MYLYLYFYYITIIISIQHNIYNFQSININMVNIINIKKYAHIVILRNYSTYDVR